MPPTQTLWQNQEVNQFAALVLKSMDASLNFHYVKPLEAKKIC